MGVDQPLELVFFIYSLIQLKIFQPPIMYESTAKPVMPQRKQERKTQKLCALSGSVVKVLALV
jgi:hypothetical protein